MVPSLVFSAREIREKGGFVFAESFPADELVGREASGSCSVRLEFSVGGESILLEGVARGHWALECSRCLRRHHEPFSVLLEETYPLDREEIDLSETMRQDLLLSVPSRSLCAPDCRGLCPQCGTELNQGPCHCRRC